MTNLYILFSLLFAGFVLLPSTLCSTVVFTDTFDTGFSSWTYAGTVSSVTTPVLSGKSVKIVQGYIQRVVSTVGYYDLSVTWNLAGSSLESLPNDQCVVELSWNSGSTWYNVFSIRNGYDTSVFYSGTINLPTAAENTATNFLFRYRAAASTGDYCYAETVTITSQTSTLRSAPTPCCTTYDPLSGSGSVTRSTLTYAQLMGTGAPTTPVLYGNLSLPANAAAPTNSFEGRLTFLNSFEITNGLTLIRDDYGYNSDLTRPYLPAINVELVQHGTHLIPVIRQNILTYHPIWEYIVEVGRVWNENGDNGYSRAIVPFALIQKNANCVHNGIFTFLFNSNSVSRVFYQIVQETCMYYKFDTSGLLNAAASFYAVANDATIRSSWATERSNRVTVQPLSQLAIDYPTVILANLVVPGSPEVAVYGVHVDTVHYRSDCFSHGSWGSYPLCDEFVLPSYSTMKASFTAVATMRVAQKYDLTVYNKPMSTITQCPAAKWSDVPLVDALDMVTGNYQSTGYMTDEDSTANNNLFLPLLYTDKINFACTNWARKSTPGTTWVYHTSDVFAAGSLLQQFLLPSYGWGSSLTQFVVQEVYQPINLSPVPQLPKFTYDTTAQVWSGWGNFYITDDVVKIANFLNTGEGKINGQQILDYNYLKICMQRNPSNRGYHPQPDTNWDYRFKMAFWAINVYNQTTDCVTYVPYLSGFGGIQIIMAPNKVNYYFFGDNDVFTWATAGLELRKIRSPCSVSYSP